MTYKPRLTQPESGNKLWTQVAYGGYNRQIIGSPTAWNGSVLANCTGYVHGRWMEIGNTTTEYSISSGNASTYYNYGDSYTRGSTPKLGAIVCYSGGYGGAGHVAIVEEIKSNGDLLVSQSNYGGTIFETQLVTKSSGYVPWGALTFQGFIYHPNVDPTPPDPGHGGGINLLMLIAVRNKQKRGKHYGIKYI